MRIWITGVIFLACAAANLSAKDLRALDADRLRVERSAAVDHLTRKGTADALAAAAVLKQFGQETDTDAYSLIERAVGLAPQRRDLAWLAVRLCDIVSDCDPVRPEQRLREVDPRNAVAFIAELSRAVMRNDAAAIDSALKGIGDSEYAYVYFNPLVAATAPELAAAKHPNSRSPSKEDLTQATIEMIGVLAASLLPPSQSVSLACRAIALQLEGRLDECRRAARALERADTFIGEGLGLSLQQKLWPLDSKEGRGITSRRRVFQYRLEEFSRLPISSPDPSEYPLGAVDVFRTHAREQDNALVYFERAHVPAEPPANWTSSQLPRVP